MTLGLLGLLTGFVSLESINHLASHYGWLVVAYLAYLAAITLWNVPFGLLIIGVCLSLLLIYVVGVTADRSSRPIRLAVIALASSNGSRPVLSS